MSESLPAGIGIPEEITCTTEPTISEQIVLGSESYKVAVATVCAYLPDGASQRIQNAVRHRLRGLAVEISDMLAEDLCSRREV